MSRQRQLSGRTRRDRTPRGALVLIALALSLSARPGQADEALAEMVRACATLRTDAERLACFDRRVVPAASGAAPVAESPSQEEMFGMSGSVASPAVEKAEAKDAKPKDAKPEEAEPESIDKISAQVTGIQTLARGEKVVTLDNGQVWQTVDLGELLLSPGDPVTITRAALGTFKLVTSSHRTARVKRVR